MTYYHLASHIYIAQFRDELILLDTKKDQYFICAEKVADLLVGLFQDTFQEIPICDTIQSLLEEGIIEKKNSHFPFSIDRKINSYGTLDVEWRLPFDKGKRTLKFSMLKALSVLTKVHLWMKIRGFHPLIELIKKTYRTRNHYIVPTQVMLEDLAGAVNQACLFFPKRTKCLEWAITYVLLAIQKGWECSLEIGVQNYTFMSHAWVESGGKVVMDSEDLRDKLAIILKEPFRERRT